MTIPRSWNYRVMRHVDKANGAGRGSEWLAIHEVYYLSRGVNDLEVTSAQVGYTENPVKVIGESVEELRDMLTKMLMALDKPILQHKEED